MAATHKESGEDPWVVVARLEREVAERDRQLAKRDVRIAELEEIVVRLTAQVEMLLQRQEQNSTNSHLPPSSDGPAAAARGTRPPKGGNSGKSKKGKKRKRGGQKGHRGSHRELLAPEHVDEVMDVYPEACGGCAGTNIRRTPDPDARRHQLIELRRGGVHVKEWRLHEGRCDDCGECTRARYDPAEIPASPFGPRFVALVVTLTGDYHLSRRRAARLCYDVFGVTISPGTISAMERQASEALEPAYEEVQREVEGAPVKHADGTSWLLAGAMMSLWVLTSASATLYKIFNDGQRKTIKPFFGRLVGILVTDRACVFDFWAMAARQICFAHLLRRFVSFSQRDGPAGTMGRELLDLTGLVFEYWHGFRAGLLDREKLVDMMRPVREQFEAALERTVAADIPGVSGSCANMLEHRQALWTFLEHEGVEPTNNAAERALRPLVLWRKRSFGCQSQRGLRFVEHLMTVTQTARQQGKGVLDFIEAAIVARKRGTPSPALLASA